MAKNVDENLIKRPYQKEKWNDEKIIEYQRCLDPDLGPLYFLSHYLYIQHPVKGKILYQPYDFQLRLIEVMHNYKDSINLCPRQSGKSLAGSTNITVRNKRTGKIYELPIGIYHEWVKSK